MKLPGVILAAIAIAVAPLHLPAQSCILQNVAVKQGCAPGSCASKRCCRDAAKNAGTTTHPIAKADAGGQVFAILPKRVTLCRLPAEKAHQSFFPASDTRSGQLRPQLALLCTFLI